MKKAKIPIGRILSVIFRTTIETGEIPAVLKLAFITGIFKSGSRTEPVNYRPISLTSHVVKVMERVLRKAVVNHLELHLKLAANQHGSRAGRSTLSQLQQHYDEILTAIESGQNMDVIYLDFSKAYDKVDHGILLHKLKMIRISGKVGRWIDAFLLDRRQQVMVKGHKSEASSLRSGVPQGSVIGPLLFLIYIGDIDDEVLAKVLVYVDDSKVKDKIMNEEDVMKLQEELDKIYG